MSLVAIYSPAVPGEGLQVTNVDLCLHIVMTTGKCKDVLRRIFCFCFLGELGGGGNVGGTSHGGRDFQ